MKSVYYQHWFAYVCADSGDDWLLDLRVGHEGACTVKTQKPAGLRAWGI